MPSLSRALRPVAVVVAVAALAAPAVSLASPTYPTSQPPHDFSALHIRNGSCAPPLDAQQHGAGSDLPPAFRCKDSQKLTSYAPQPGDPDYDPAVENNPQELYGVKGSSTNRAWEVTTGRPDTVIAVLDSGILWDTPELVDKVELNRGELPPPCLPGTTCDSTRGDAHAVYDVNDDGVLSVSDYRGDPRVLAAVPEARTRGFLTPEDLIRTFSDGIDHDGNGYVNDIAGWDFYQHDNDPADDVTYGHGTGEAKDSNAEATATTISQCPSCRFVPLRVGDSFIADINHFAAAVVYATDNGVSVVQEALGTLNHTAFAQAALDYAYAHGVLVVASEADEEAGHHNYPAALNHTMVVNSVTHFADQNGVAVQSPKTYLAFNGCTNWGGYTWVTVESNSCSSDATGQSSGIAGLIYSAARNAVQHHVIQPDASGRPLSAEEAKQLFRLGADDVDFATPRPPFPPNNRVTTLPDTVRYPTTPGWDMFTGFGRINANTAVRLVAAGKIPGEADITSPRWWSPLGTTGTVPVIGRVAAPRARSYTYEVQVAPGVQPPAYPLADGWTTLATGTGSRAKQGVLATLDLAKVRALLDAAPPPFTAADDPTSPDQPEKDAFRVRVVVHTPGMPDAVEQRQYFAHADPGLAHGFPRYLDADVTAGAFADLDGDGRPELVVGDGNGLVHAFRADGREVPGWPVRTERLTWLPAGGSNGFTRGEVSADVHAPLLLGSPLVADLNHDGYPEVAVADLEGTLHVFDHLGHEVPGFPVHTDPAYSHDPGCEVVKGPICDHYVPHHVRDHVNTVDKAFAATPSAGDLDPSHPGLEIVAGAMDGHVYAWHDDGTPVPGWPVQLRDPAKVASVDPVSHFLTFKPGADPKYGRQVVTTPTIADLNGDGRPEVVVNVDEEYAETPSYGARAPLAALLGRSGVLSGGNTRVYALWADGTRHPGASRVRGLGDNAYVPGWPVPIGMAETEVLPDVGSGSNGSPVVGRMLPGGKPQVATASVAGPPYLLNADGTSAYGSTPDGGYLTMASEAAEFKGNQTDGPSYASLGGGALGRLGPAGTPLSFAMGATGLKRLLDLVLPDQQLGAEDHVSAWDTATGTYEPGFPARMNDLQFFTSPAIADVDGSGRPAVLQGSAVSDLRAYRLGGTAPSGWPKFTGGWTTQTSAVGDLDGDGTVEVAAPTREGYLFVWRTTGSACSGQEWPKYQHDARNSGDYDTDATPPGALRAVSLHDGRITVTASGDDGWCPGTAKHYVLVVDGSQRVLATVPAAAGTRQVLDVAGLLGDASSVQLSVEDAAGNLSYPVPVLGRVPGSPGERGAGHRATSGAARTAQERAAQSPAMRPAATSRPWVAGASLVALLLLALTALRLRRS